MPRKPIRIAVLSDQHIDCEAYPESWELAKVAFKAVAAKKPDHVVLAGDVFDSATAMERDREKVSRHLKGLGLWHRDRLSIVVGNHDIFHHSGRRGFDVTSSDTWSELGKSVALSAQDHYESFCSWASDLAYDADLLDGEHDLYPFEKVLGHVRLLAMDTTEVDTRVSSYGRWPGEDDALVRDAWGDSSERRVLAIHNAPEACIKYGPKDTVWRILRGAYPGLGFPTASLKKLNRFARDLSFEAIVCGHLHVTPKYDWFLEGGTAVHVVGRTGSVDETDPCCGVLEVPLTGVLRWKVVGIRG